MIVPSDGMYPAAFAPNDGTCHLANASGIVVTVFHPESTWAGIGSRHAVLEGDEVHTPEPVTNWTSIGTPVAEIETLSNSSPIVPIHTSCGPLFLMTTL